MHVIMTTQHFIHLYNTGIPDYQIDYRQKVYT
jgi:hypothetical protein